MRTRLPFVVPVLASSLLAACGGDSSPDANFSKASSDDRQAAVGAARGDAAQVGTLFAFAIGASALETRAACPKATLDGDVLTIKGGCTAGGVKLDGKAVLHGFSTEDDDIELRKISFDDFGFSQGGNKLSFDGSVELAASSGNTGTVISDLTLTATFDGIRHAVTVSSTLACTASGACTAGDDSTVDVDGVGIATINGTWGGDGSAQGSLSLAGADTLRVDFDRAAGDDCYATTIDGVTVDPVCLDSLDEEEESDDSDSVVGAAARFAASSLR